MDNILKSFDSKELLRWGYRILLGRESECEDVLMRKVSSIAELQNIFFDSSEYKERFPSVHPYIGYIPDVDIALLKKYRQQDIEQTKGYLTDFMGNCHAISDLPHLTNRNGDVVQHLPIPDDTFHAETIEYVALFHSIEASQRDEYTMFELGAGWGPWMCSAGISARRKGIKKINLIGVEGATNKIPLIKRHLTNNGLRPDVADMVTVQDGLTVKIYEGVVNSDGKKAQFPKIPIEHYGASLLTNVSDARDFDEVQGYLFSELSQDYAYIDFVHIDIQGYEENLLTSSIECFKSKVKYMAIGTHSRRIEGFLSEFLYIHNFKCLREKPCIVQWPKSMPDNFIDIITKDGMQFWENMSID